MTIPSDLVSGGTYYIIAVMDMTSNDTVWMNNIAYHPIKIN